MSDNTNDLQWGLIDEYSRTYRVFVFEVFVGKRLIDNRDWCGTFIIGRCKESTTLKWSTHHIQVVRFNRIDERIVHITCAGRFRLTLDPKVQIICTLYRKPAIGQRHSFDSRRGPDLLIQLAERGPDGLRTRIRHPWR